LANSTNSLTIQLYTFAEKIQRQGRLSDTRRSLEGKHRLRSCELMRKRSASRSRPSNALKYWSSTRPVNLWTQASHYPSGVHGREHHLGNMGACALWIGAQVPCSITFQTNPISRLDSVVHLIPSP